MKITDQLLGITRTAKHYFSEELPRLATRKYLELPSIIRNCYELRGIARNYNQLQGNAKKCQDLLGIKLSGVAKDCQRFSGSARN